MPPLTRLFLIGGLFLALASDVWANPESRPEGTWENLLSRCVRGTDYIPHDNLSDRMLNSYAWPEGAPAVAHRARRCQDKVRSRLHHVAAQCLDEWAVRDLRRGKRAWSADDHHRRTVGAVYNYCPDQYADLLERFQDCCTVIPGY